MKISDLLKWEFIIRKGGGWKKFICHRCGNSFIRLATSKRLNYRYCSNKCRRGKQSKQRRSTRKFHISNLVKDFGGICVYCGKPVDLTKRVPHNNAPTKDHLIPLSKGGESSYKNIVLSHYKCNRLKAAKIVDINQIYK